MTKKIKDFYVKKEKIYNCSKIKKVKKIVLLLRNFSVCFENAKFLIYKVKLQIFSKYNIVPIGKKDYKILDI